MIVALGEIRIPRNRDPILDSRSLWIIRIQDLDKTILRKDRQLSIDSPTRNRRKKRTRCVGLTSQHETGTVRFFLIYHPPALHISKKGQGIFGHH